MPNLNYGTDVGLYSLKKKKLFLSLWDIFPRTMMYTIVWDILPPIHKVQSASWGVRHYRAREEVGLHDLGCTDMTLWEINDMLQTFVPYL